ncbi:hypothetical protein Q5752_003809 [Cryptotrichosporon argae]
MFKKALAHQSNATPLRSSARRQLLASVYAQYPMLVPPAGEEKEAGRALVPESVRSCAFETSGGVEGTAYLSPDGDPLWLTFGRGSKNLIPTLHLLSLPRPTPPLPMVQIYHPLPPPLLTGAPLFFAAVRNTATPWLLPDVAEGGLVALAAGPSPDALSYVAVGRVVSPGGVRGALETRRKAVDGAVSEEGRFCDILCIIDDHLWALGSKPSLPTFSLPRPVNPLVPPPEPAQAIADLTLTGADAAPASDPAPKTSSAPLSPAEVSTLLSLALLQTLTTLKPGTLPMPASTLYATAIIPNRPAYIPLDRRDDVVIAKSEWKKLARWMKDTSKDGLLKIKEAKGEVVVTGYDADHPSLSAHVEHKTIGQEEARAAKRAARDEAAAAAVGEMAVAELWKPSPAAAAFWDDCGVDKTAYHPASDLKPVLDGYLARHGLVVPTDHRHVQLDPVLAAAIGLKKDAPAVLSRDDVLLRLRARVAWATSVNGQVRKGPLMHVSISTKARQGRKMVTLVAHLEGFGLDPDAFAEEMRKKCAGATSVQPLTGASPKSGLKEVLVQGSQGKAVVEALLAKGVPRRWIKEDK